MLAPSSAPFSFSGSDAFEALCAALADAVVIVEPSGRLVHADPRFAEALGYRAADVLGRELRSFLHPDAPIRDENDGAFWAAPAPFERTLRMQTAAGDWAWMTISSAASGPDGRPAAALARVLGDRSLLFVRPSAPARAPQDALGLVLRALDAVDNLVVVSDARLPDAPIVHANQNFLDVTGYAREEVLGRNCRFLQTRPDGTRDDDGDGQAEALAAIRHAVAAGEAVEVTLRNYTKEGRLFYNRLHLSPVTDADGTVTHFIGTQADVTAEVEERRRADDQRQLLAAFFDGAPFLMGVLALDDDGGLRHRAANEAALALFGSVDAAAEAPADGAPLTAIGFPEAEAQRWAAHVRASAGTGEAVSFQAAFPWGADAAADDTRRLEVAVAPGGEGLFAYVIEDVTDRHAAEEERRLLAAAVEQAAEAIVVTGIEVERPGPRILYANRAHERIFGYTLEEILGESPRIFQGPKSDRVVLDRVRRALSAGESVEAETVNYRKDGSEFILQWEIAPVKDEHGRVTTWVGTQRDVTERRRLEAEVLEASAREQERLARDLHDGLGQVLTGAAFRLQALRQTLVEHGEEALAEDANRTRQIVNAAHEQARAIAHGLAPVAVELDGLMVALERLADDAATAYGIRCTFHAGATVRVGSIEQAGHLYRIVQEAIANAARHGRAREVTVSLDAVEDAVTLAIEDNGRGIAPERLETARGLGLRTMRYRADRVGASLEIGPREAGGTRVALTFRPAGPLVTMSD